MKQNASGSRKAHPMFFVLFVLLCSIGIYGKLGQYPLRWSDAFSLGNERSAQLALNPFQSFFSSLDYRHINYDLNSTQATYKQMADYLGVDCKDAAVLNYNRTIKAANTSLPAPNIVLVICESFSAYKSSMWGNPLNPTPFFNTLCSQGIFFDHCFTPHFGTARGVWSTLTGLPDVLLENTASRNPLLVDQHCLINDFTDYHKYYFIGGSASWANIKGLLLNNIDSLKLYEGNDFKDVPKLDVWGISDKNLFLQANQILAREKKPFFAVIQTADNHRPYTIPKEDRAEFTDVTLPDDSLHKYGYQRNNELNAFRFTDFCFKKFIEAARKEKYFANTIFVFVGDHGIRGNAGTMFPNAWTNNGLTSFHVPLLFYAPAFLNAARYPQNCSQLDVLPTLAGLAHIGYINTGLGQDLLKADRPAANTAFIIDHDARSIGLVSGNYFFSRNLSSGTKSLVSIINNEPIVQNAYTDSLEKALNSLNDAFYETSKYLLFHNKKPAKAKP
jgi:phosphoglycerol transferase MdoB-like AlkP superfamily enzyme